MFTGEKHHSLFLISTCIIPSGAIQDSGNCLGPLDGSTCKPFHERSSLRYPRGVGGRNFIKSGYLISWGKGHGEVPWSGGHQDREREGAPLGSALIGESGGKCWSSPSTYGVVGACS